MSASGSSAGQSPEEVHRLVASAAVQHRPIAARYDGPPRLLCPHVVGYNSRAIGECSVISTAEKPRTDPCRAAMRDLALPFFDKALERGMVGWSLAY
jgi:hypothetical protein